MNKTGEPTALITPEDIERGEKTVAFTTIDGRKLETVLKFPTWRERRTILGKFIDSQDPVVLMGAIYTGEQLLDTFLDCLAPDSVSLFENLAIAIVVGEEHLKKTLHQMEELKQKMGSPFVAAPKPAS